MTNTKMFTARLSQEARDIIEAYMTEHNLSSKTEALEKLLRIKTQVADPEETQKLKDRIKELKCEKATESWVNERSKKILDDTITALKKLQKEKVQINVVESFEELQKTFGETS